MSSVIDMSKDFRIRQYANILARDGVKLYCHPHDKHKFAFLPEEKIEISVCMEKGKPLMIDTIKLKEFIKGDLKMDYKL